MSSLDKRTLGIALLVAVLAAGASSAVTAAAVSDSDSDSTSDSVATSAVEHLNADPATTSPYSDVVAVGSTLHLAGNLGLDAAGKVVPGGLKAQTTQMMANLKAALEKNGSSLEKVFNCEVMLSTGDAADTVKEFIKARDSFNEVYSTYWQQGRFPARHAFGVTGLYLGALVEIACVAVRRCSGAAPPRKRRSDPGGQLVVGVPDGSGEKSDGVSDGEGDSVADALPVGAAVGSVVGSVPGVGVGVGVGVAGRGVGMTPLVLRVRPSLVSKHASNSNMGLLKYRPDGSCSCCGPNTLLEPPAE
jgi:2-iminobutanoate/2-iminopropanoate deaminase